ncbi:pyridoxal-phosphate dependent enzyme [Nonomuraea sp. NPDC049709]|uniref:pyridoxal-phosphate dependent enzyme n=1 Tax=Nonomuraea sp. NPDC049709 TaxID=3154736 RepID=UPI003447CF2E
MLGATGNTPITSISLEVGGIPREIFVKLEWFNPTGSLKDRTAISLLATLVAGGELGPDHTLIESTSGNLGVALAFATSALRIPFVAVVDSRACPANVRRMRAYGASVRPVESAGDGADHLAARLEEVDRLLRADTGGALVWPNQYRNEAGADIHYRTTGPELYEQLDRDVDALFVAVSTGGSLAGVARFFREMSPRTVIVAVDSAGSAAIGGLPGPRRLVGIGSSRPSLLLSPALYDERIWVTDAAAFAMCRTMWRVAGLFAGGSSGAVVAACVDYLGRHPEVRRPACVLVDAGTAYVDTIYDDAWLEAGAPTDDALSGTRRYVS